MDRRIDDAAHIVEIDNMAASYLDKTEKVFEEHFVDINKMMTDYDSARRLVNGKWDWELINGFGKALHAALIDAWSWGTESVVKNLSRRVANQVQYVFDLKFAEAEKALRLQAFTIAGIKNGEVLQNIKNILIDCLDEGLTFQQFQDRANLSMAESGFVKPRWHLELIYRNNLMTAFHTGRYAQLMDEDVRMEFPLWEYNAILDGAVRPSHAAMDGKRFLSNDPIWDKWYPPNGHNCRCGVSAVSKYEMEEENIQPTGPPPVSVEPDFGWERNAGKDLVWLEKWQEGKMRGMGGAKVPEGKAEAKAGFVPAKTVAEAEEWAKNNKILTINSKDDYLKNYLENIPDEYKKQVMENWNNILKDSFEDIDAESKLKFMNSLNKIISENPIIKEFINKNEIRFCFRNQGDVDFDGGNKFAIGEAKGKFNIIDFFTKNKSNMLSKKLDYNKLDEIIAHEIGHIFSYKTGFQNSKEQISLFAELLENINLRKFSPYARTNPEEMTAEFFAGWFSKNSELGKKIINNKDFKDFAEKIINFLGLK